MANFETSANFRITLMHQENETPMQMVERFRTFLLQYASVVKDVDVEEVLQTRQVNDQGF